MALEQLKPQLQKLAGEERLADKTPAVSSSTELCRACGQPFAGNESSCVHCGASRATGQYPGTQLQSKWAALWERQMLDVDHAPSFRKAAPEAELEETGDPIDFDLPPEPEMEGSDEEAETSLVLSGHRAYPSSPADEAEDPAEEFVEPVPAVVLHNWTDRLRTFARNRGGDVSLVLAGLVFAIVLSWGLWSNPVNSAASAHKSRPSAPQLSLLEKALVSFGLAVPPPAPEYHGNPNVKVWVDVQTGLYYCPGVSLYGSTPKGRYSSQSEAQQDQFEPAARTPCE
jgi:hypothetical protein